jgi:hypothetical protein
MNTLAGFNCLIMLMYISVSIRDHNDLALWAAIIGLVGWIIVVAIDDAGGPHD